MLSHPGLVASPMLPSILLILLNIFAETEQYPTVPKSVEEAGEATKKPVEDKKWFLGWSESDWANMVFAVPLLCLCYCITIPVCYFFGCYKCFQKVDKVGNEDLKVEEKTFGGERDKKASRIDRGSKELDDMERGSDDDKSTSE